VESSDIFPLCTNNCNLSLLVVAALRFSINSLSLTVSNVIEEVLAPLTVKLPSITNLSFPIFVENLFLLALCFKVLVVPAVPYDKLAKDLPKFIQSCLVTDL